MSGIPAGAGQLLGKRLGKYEILALLALGGTAEIYLARIGGAAGFEKYVVVKCLHDHLADDAEFVKMFLDEARLAAHLDHSNIVQTMELGQHDGRYYMVMEFLAGLSLAMVVRRATERLPGSRVPVQLVLNILAQSCAGLHYAHEKTMNGKALNIVHRDISPQNLVISFEGVVKLVDFGIAKAELRETRTRSGTIKGKFAYMSPEQCVAHNVDRRTDVFALGVIAHELLTGQRLFKRASPYETYQAVIECKVKPPSAIDASVDPAIDPVIMRAITKDKADRYPTAEAFGDALLGYLHHRGIGSGPGDVSRFFDAHFAQEIEEHSARMRELISGRDVPVDTGVNWGADDPEDEAKREAATDQAGKKPALAGDKPRAQGPGESDPVGRPSAGSLSMVIDDLGGGGARGEDGDELPADRTRIESNPLEKLNELDRVAATAAMTPVASKPPAATPVAPKPSAATPVAPKPTATPAPRPVAPQLPPSGALPLPPAPKPGSAASASPPGMPPSGRFPELANLPTMIAQPDAGAAPHDPGASSENLGFLDLPTEIAPSGVPPAAPGFANAPTGFASPSVPPGAAGFSDASPALVSPPPPALARTQIAPGPMGLPSYASSGMPPPGAPVPPMQHPGSPQGYPVMNAQLSAQIATGATVFPSDHRGGQSPPAPYGPPGVPPSGPAIGPSLGPSPGGAPRVPDSGPGPMFPHHGHPVDPALGPAHGQPHGMAGPPHSEHGHWGAMAASRMRSAPPWMLAVLFVVALGVALLLTIVIAKIIR